MKITDVKAVLDLSYCIGNYGHYFTCLCIAAEKITKKNVDILKTAQALIGNGCVDYDEKRPRAYRNSMYVCNPDNVLKYLGCKEHVEKVNKLPEDYKGIYITRYTLNGKTDFVFPKYNLRTDSDVVKNGRITAYYLIKQ